MIYWRTFPATAVKFPDAEPRLLEAHFIVRDMAVYADRTCSGR
jgi:hypothetical protein